MATVAARVWGVVEAVAVGQAGEETTLKSLLRSVTA
jgi:hypothetical protein